MSGIHDQRNQFHHADPEKIKLSPIFPKKQESNLVKFKNLKLKSELLLELFVRKLIEEKCSKLLEGEKKNQQTVSKPLKGSLETFKLLFYKLSLENASQNYLFAEELSKSWHEILFHLHQMKSLSHPPKYLGLLEIFTKEVNDFPHKNEYSLGYYLTKYAGEKWLPFPFMDILSQLHEDALLKKAKSRLNDWVESLSLILNEIK